MTLASQSSLWITGLSALGGLCLWQFLQLRRLRGALRAKDAAPHGSPRPALASVIEARPPSSEPLHR